jgi:hypothetical protein
MRVAWLRRRLSGKRTMQPLLQYTSSIFFFEDCRRLRLCLLGDVQV